MDLVDKNHSPSVQLNPPVIIGTGRYGLALGRRLISFGFNVIYGSREPNKNFISKNFPNDQESVQLMSINEAWSIDNSNIVFFAVNVEAHEDLVRKLCLNNNIQIQQKIVIDVSNDMEENKSVESSAEILQKRFNKYTDKIIVIKAFNNVSAVSMNFDLSNKAKINDEMILIAGNDSHAVKKIINLANHIGFQAFQIGLLDKAKKLELSNGKVFQEWQIPSLFITGFLIFNLIWYFFYSYISNAKYSNFDQYLKSFSLLPYLNRVFAFTSINLLSYVYLAGVTAIAFKFYYANSSKRFPKYLDFWLKSRKYLGLWAFFYATLHVLITMCILTPAHFSPWFKPTIQSKLMVNSSNGSIDAAIKDAFIQTRFTFHAELNIFTGIIAYSIMVILAICSINSIASSLNWSEWTFVQSKCGIMCLFFSLVHDLIMFLRFIIEKDIHKYSYKHIFTRVKFYTIWLPLIVIIFRFIFTFIEYVKRRMVKIKNRNSGDKYNRVETTKI
jgi:predicted dinucleotide-binding enzyme/DMSO/TMAO reductase YedYZ heme-binding membrane subunit